MKKFTGFVAILGLLLLAVQAQAVTLGLYEKGALVPNVIHNGSTVDTVVGVLCELDCTGHNDTATGTVYWTFFDVNSTHVTDGVFTCTDDDLYGFSWMANSGRGLEDTSGYLVFVADPTNDALTISANAFLVDTTAKDAIFVPVIPLSIDDFADGFDPRAMNADTLQTLTNGTKGGTTVDMRYWIDPAAGAATTLVVWLTEPVGSQTVLVYNDEEESKSVNIDLNSELNKICPGEIVGMPLDYVDGFVQLTLPDSVDGFAYSYISSSLFGAQQTLLAAECAGAATTSPSTVSTCGCTSY